MMNETNFLTIISLSICLAMCFVIISYFILRIINFANEIIIIFSIFIIFIFFLNLYCDNYYLIMLVALLNLAFIMTYPALREEIPTFKIIRIISTNKSTKSVIAKKVLEEINLDLKINQAISNNLIYIRGEQLSLTYIGLIIAIFFIFFRKILGLNKI